MSEASTKAYDWILLMVGASLAMPEETRAELLAWEDANIDGHSVGTMDWPGWEPILGRPFPTLEPRIERTKATISAALRRAVYERDAYRCRGCGTWEDLSVDHVIAESKGGPTTLENLQTLCRPCNASKGVR